MSDISEKEIQLINLLRERISDLLDSDYKNSNAYLIPWIRYRKHDVSEAEIYYRETIAWKKERNLDSVLDEDLNLPKGFKISTCVANDGRPVIVAKYGQWDFAKELEKGNRNNVLRFFYQFCERFEFEIEKQYAKNKTVNQWIGIFDVAGFSYKQLASPRCVQLLADVAKFSERHYPMRINSLYIINAPSVVKLAIYVIKPFLSSTTLGTFHVYNSNKKDWTKVLAQRISPDQHPIELQE